MKLVFIDELPIEFEEVFTAIVENGGKMVWKRYSYITLEVESQQF
jgi:hypothetical protein